MSQENEDNNNKSDIEADELDIHKSLNNQIGTNLRILPIKILPYPAPPNKISQKMLKLI